MIRKQALDQATDFLIFCLLVILFCSDSLSSPFFGDESQWIYSSEVFEAYFGGDFDSSLWDESYWTLTQPPLPRYFIGLGRWMGEFGIDELNLPWKWDADEQTNINEGRKPSEELLWWARLPMKILAALAIFIVFLILKNYFNRLPAYLWILLCLLNSYFPFMLCRAMGEAPLLFFICLCLFISILQFQNADKPILYKQDKMYWLMLVMGIAIGFAESSKLNGLSVIAAAFAMVLIIGTRLKLTRTIRIRFCLISSLTLIFSSQFAFIILNPYLWKDPLMRIIAMFMKRIYEMGIQQNLYSDSVIQGFSERIRILSERIFENYSSIHFEGALWFNIFFFLIGMIYFFVKTVQYFYHSYENPAATAILIVGAATLLPSLLTPLDWDRYYLFPIFFSTLAITIGIWQIGLWVYHRIVKQVKVLLLNTFWIGRI